MVILLLVWLAGIPVAGRVITWVVTGVGYLISIRARSLAELAHSQWRLVGLPHMIAVLWWPLALSTILLAGLLILAGFRFHPYHEEDEDEAHADSEFPLNYPPATSSLPAVQPSGTRPHLKIFEP